jgi:hypothetical protein
VVEKIAPYLVESCAHSYCVLQQLLTILFFQHIASKRILIIHVIILIIHVFILIITPTVFVIFEYLDTAVSLRDFFIITAPVIGR